MFSLCFHFTCTFTLLVPLICVFSFFRLLFVCTQNINKINKKIVSIFGLFLHKNHFEGQLEVKMTKIQRNFFNLAKSSDFQESIFQCQLGLSMGFTRRCYICDHYDYNILTLPDCKPSCVCKKITKREELVKHLCGKIFKAIDNREIQGKDIFIISLGYQRTAGKHQVFAEYMVPMAASSEPIIRRLDMKSFTQSFQDCSDSRLHNLN